jgi:hypothetical protein
MKWLRVLDLTAPEEKVRITRPKLEDCFWALASTSVALSYGLGLESVTSDKVLELKSLICMHIEKTSPASPLLQNCHYHKITTITTEPLSQNHHFHSITTITASPLSQNHHFHNITTITI